MGHVFSCFERGRPGLLPDAARHLQAELFDRYPRLSGKGRPLRTSEDSTGETSFETYLRGELKTYSARTITLLHELTLRQQQDGVNGAALNLLNQVQQYGYATLEQAEGHRAGG